MIFRVAKPISACAALAFRRSMYAAKAISGLFAALIHRPNVPVLISDEALASIPDRPLPGPAIPLSATQKESEWEQRVKAVVSLAKEEIAEILPGWLIDIDTFESPHIGCYEFVLRAETPMEWGRYRLADGDRIVEGRPKQVWGARLPVSYIEMSYAMNSMPRLMQFVLGKLSEFARDIRRNVPAPPESEPCCRVP